MGGWEGVCSAEGAASVAVSADPVLLHSGRVSAPLAACTIRQPPAPQYCVFTASFGDPLYRSRPADGVWQAAAITISRPGGCPALPGSLCHRHCQRQPLPQAGLRAVEPARRPPWDFLVHITLQNKSRISVRKTCEIAAYKWPWREGTGEQELQRAEVVN